MTGATNTKTASDAAMTALTSLAADCAMRGAATYLATEGFAVKDDAAAVEVIRRHTKAALPQAILDARAAVDAGMSEVAITDLKASFWLAGIAAAKEIMKG